MTPEVMGDDCTSIVECNGEAPATEARELTFALTFIADDVVAAIDASNDRIVTPVYLLVPEQAMKTELPRLRLAFVKPFAMFGASALTANDEWLASLRIAGARPAIDTVIAGPRAVRVGDCVNAAIQGSIVEPATPAAELEPRRFV